MTAAYGGYDIGKRKSKPIIYSIGLATAITDLVTYLQLMIMNTNASNNYDFKFENLGILALTLIGQVVIITVMTYLGNYIYFRINHPERCCIVAQSKLSCNGKEFNDIVAGISKFKKQY